MDRRANGRAGKLDAGNASIAWRAIPFDENDEQQRHATDSL
jgi:hypothetical protein